MPPGDYNAFAKIYRDLLATRGTRREKGKGFFAQAAAKMRECGLDYSPTQLASIAHFRRRIGDVNFPRVKGSQDIERMQVARVERLRALGVMATGLMHEILQPLQVILSTAEHQKRQVEKGIVDVDPLRERLARVITQTKLMNDVVQHVRSLASASEPQVGPVDLNQALTRALTLFQEQLKSRGIEVDRSGLPADLPPISADAVSVERIFINLILNARDAIEETKCGSGQIKFWLSKAPMAWSAKSPTTGRESPRESKTASSTRTSPPSPSARARGWG